MSGKLFDKYGAILAEDVEVLERCLLAIIADRRSLAGDFDPVVFVLEIGMHDGGTARGIERFLTEHDCALAYIGIDPDDGTSRPRHVPRGGRVIVGDSSEVFMQVPGGLDLVWVDGCHCINHVILDTLHYAPKVSPGGFMCFHDINPAGQGHHHQPCGGPKAKEFGLATDMAHKALGFPRGDWKLFAEKWPTDDPGTTDCGTRAFRKDDR